MANTPYNNPTSTGLNTPAPLDTDALRDDAAGVVDEVKSVAGKVADEARDTAGSVMDQAKTKDAEAAEKAKSMASEQKDLLAEQLGGISGAVRRTADDLESENAPTAQYARMVADGADRLTSLVRDNDVDAIMAAA